MISNVISISLITLLICRQDVDAGIYDEPQTIADRTTMVHLFEWKWTDVAKECETFLSKYGYGAVQISPPNEHLFKVVPYGSSQTHPWWVRYQPVSYELYSRSGTPAEFVDMVQRCNKVGVRIIVDTVINHMVIVGQKTPGQWDISSWGPSTFDGTDGIESFPGVPYSNLDFNDQYCHGDIKGEDYGNNAWAVRKCRLDGLLDLDHSKDWVRQRIAGYLNKLIDIGVAGIRIDAAKHMFPVDIEAIVNKMKNLNETIYGPNQRPFVAQEVIDRGNEAIKSEEYFNNGRVTNFIYGIDLAAAVRKQKNFKYFYNFGPAWNYFPDNEAVVFVDNHDNQRTETVVLTYKDGQKYVVGVTYMLAWTYGYPRLMSSYYFNDKPQGPPSVGAPSWTITSPKFNPDDTCDSSSGWTCEHRWPAIRRMVTFRQVTTNEAPANIITDDHRIAFRRGSKGFFALNNAQDVWNRRFYVGLPQGNYCDVISGELKEDKSSCTGATVNVDDNGNADVSVQAGYTLALHVGQRVGGRVDPTKPPLSVGYRRTVIMIQKETSYGQSLFIRGGLDHGTHGCSGDTSASQSHCAIPIVHKTNFSRSFSRAYGYMSQDDNYLDFFGVEPNQGTDDGVQAAGSPLIWTTNNTSKVGYHPLNVYGENYWLVDVMMDCDKTDNGWFVFKSVLRKSAHDNTGDWESDINQASVTCKGGDTQTPTNIGSNHAGKCGSINVYSFSKNECEIKPFSVRRA